MMWKISDNLGREYFAREENNIFTINKDNQQQIQSTIP